MPGTIHREGSTGRHEPGGVSVRPALWRGSPGSQPPEPDEGQDQNECPKHAGKRRPHHETVPPSSRDRMNRPSRDARGSARKFAEGAVRTRRPIESECEGRGNPGEGVGGHPPFQREGNLLRRGSRGRRHREARDRWQGRDLPLARERHDGRRGRHHAVARVSLMGLLPAIPGERLRQDGPLRHVTSGCPGGPGAGQEAGGHHEGECRHATTVPAS